MPIKAEWRRKLYNTSEWRKQRDRLMKRAANRCECTGECGKEHDDGRCTERHMKKAKGDGVRAGVLVVLGPAHKDQRKSGEVVGDDELVLLCSGCHLRYDLDYHLQTRIANKIRALEIRGQGRLF